MRVWLPGIRVGTGADVFTDRLADALRARGVAVEQTWFHGNYEFFPELMRLRALPAGIELIHANSGIAGAFLGRGVPVVATVHHLVHDPAYAPYRSPAQALYHRWHVRWREGLAIRDAASVTAVSPYVAGTVRDVFGRADVAVIPNWIDCDRYRPVPRHDRDDGVLRLLWVGNPSRRKGADLLPRLARELGAGFEIRCVGGLRGDRNHAVAAPGLVWLDRLSEDELIAEYQRCDVLLSLSRYEGFGYTALEAMACGKPVVAFAAGGLVDVVQDGVTGFLSEVGDVDALAARVRQLAKDRALGERMGHAGREQACRSPSAVDAYLHLYERVLDRTPVSP